MGFDVLPGHRSGVPERIGKMPRGFRWNQHRQKVVQAGEGL
jgi:hypothetical protein